MRRILSVVTGICILAFLLIGHVAGVLSDKQTKSISFRMNEANKPRRLIVVLVDNPEMVTVKVPEGYEVLVMKRK